MRHIRAIFTIAVLLSGCATTSPLVSDPASGNCSVYVYRNQTTFHIADPEKPYLYVDGDRVGTLTIGESTCLNLPDGKHSISVKKPLLFVPTFPGGRVELDVQRNHPIYVRYAEEFTGMVFAGGTASATGNSTFGVVNEDAWKARR